MPVLTDEERAQITAQFMSDTSALGEELGAVTKADIRAAVDATDDWRISVQASGNAALPQPFRAEATVSQKSRVTVLILEKAYQKDLAAPPAGDP